MPQPVERAPNPSRARLLSRRRFLILGGSSSSILLLAACQRAGAPPAPPANIQEPIVARTREAIATSAPAAAVQPTAAPAA